MVASLYHLNQGLRLLAGLVVGTLLLMPGHTFASNLQVGASVPYPAPSQAATIDGNLDGSTVNVALQTLTGTCQLQNPADVVAVWRDGNAIGSAPCNGTYSLQIMLRPGDNLLTVRTANASNLYGPDSAPITVTLVLPPDPTPPADPVIPGTTIEPDETPMTPQNQTPAQIIETTNAGAATDLLASPTEPFSVLTSNNDVTVNVTVGGGQSPYTIRLDWGDGSTEMHSVDQAGTYSFTHAYVSSGNYMVRGNVYDVLGASTQFSYAVISSAPQPRTDTIVTAAVGQQQNPILRFLTEHWKPIIGSGAAAMVAGGGYMIGLHRGVGQLVTQSTQSASKGAKHATRIGRRR